MRAPPSVHSSRDIWPIRAARRLTSLDGTQALGNPPWVWNLRVLPSSGEWQ